MAEMPQFTPVEGDPFADLRDYVALIPVEGDPFNGEAVREAELPATVHWKSAPAVAERQGMLQRLSQSIMGALRKRGEMLRDHPTPATDAMVQGTIDAVNFPAAAMRGEVDPLSDEGIALATQLAGLVTLGAGAIPKRSLNELGMGIRAYHGSPHDFDRFSMEKIGTGEGAQAYGHGLYFAEREGVARSYRDQLKTGDNNSIVHIGDRDFPSDMGNYYLRQEMEKAVPPDAMNFVSGRETYDFYNKELGDAAYRGLKRAAPTDDPVQAMAEAMDAKIKALSPYEDELPSVMAMRDAALAYAKDNVRLSPNGRMYEVDINASPDEFLDWDKPLSEQPELMARLSASKRKAVQDVLGNDMFADVSKNMQSYGRDLGPVTGEQLIKALSIAMEGKTVGGKASEALRSAGIKGIRYRDAGSRNPGFSSLTPEQLDARIKALESDIAAGGGNQQKMKDQLDGLLRERETYRNITHNYVVFDDNIIDILKKYGIAGLTAGGAGALAAGSEESPDEQSR